MQLSELTDRLRASSETVLDAMYFTTVETVSFAGDVEHCVVDLAFVLHFAGEVSGTFGTGCSFATARSIGSNFLGEDEDALSASDLAEVVGELTNMLCGSMLSQVEASSKFALSHPEPVLEFPAPADALLMTLETDNGPIFTCLVLHQSRGAEDLGSSVPARGED